VLFGAGVFAPAPVIERKGLPFGSRSTLPCLFSATTSSTVFGVVVFEGDGAGVLDVGVGAGIGVGAEYDHVVVSSEVSVSEGLVWLRAAVADAAPPLSVPPIVATTTGFPGGKLTSWQVVVAPEVLQPAPSPQIVVEPTLLNPDVVTVSSVLNATPPLFPIRIVSCAVSPLTEGLIVTFRFGGAPPPPPPLLLPPPLVPLEPAAGVTAFEAGDGAPLPAVVVAVTVKLYEVPFERPETVMGLAGPVAVAPPGEAVTV
jgi:hypothetical protein